MPAKAFGVFALVTVMSAAQAPPAVPANQLVREVVYNELHDHEHHGYWRYLAERHLQQGDIVEDQIETADGTVKEVLLINHRPLNATARRNEQQRLDRLLASDAEKAHLRQAHSEDEKRIGRILSLMPDAFLFDYAGAENGCWHYRYRPNPRYSTQSIEGRVFHAMSGDLWIDSRMKHLIRLDGQLQANVDFGFGILGRLYKGGWFRLERVRVSATEWKTSRLELHMNGRAMLFKTIGRETCEFRRNFTPVPAAMSVKQGVELLSTKDLAAMPVALTTPHK